VIGPAPDTVTEAVRFLNGEGYRDELHLDADGTTAVVVDYTFRFEGPTDPGDEAIVLGVHYRLDDRKAVLVAAFGPDVDSDSADVLRSLVRSPARG